MKTRTRVPITVSAWRLLNLFYYKKQLTLTSDSTLRSLRKQGLLEVERGNTWTLTPAGTALIDEIERSTVEFTELIPGDRFMIDDTTRGPFIKLQPPLEDQTALAADLVTGHTLCYDTVHDRSNVLPLDP